MRVLPIVLQRLMQILQNHLVHWIKILASVEQIRKWVL